MFGEIIIDKRNIRPFAYTLHRMTPAIGLGAFARHMTKQFGPDCGENGREAKIDIPRQGTLICAGLTGLTKWPLIGEGVLCKRLERTGVRSLTMSFVTKGATLYLFRSLMWTPLQTLMNGDSSRGFIVIVNSQTAETATLKYALRSPETWSADRR